MRKTFSITVSFAAAVLWVAGCSSNGSTPDRGGDRGLSRDLPAAVDGPRGGEMLKFADRALADGVAVKPDGATAKVDGVKLPDGAKPKVDAAKPKVDAAKPKVDASTLLSCDQISDCSDLCSAACKDFLCRMNCPTTCKVKGCPSAVAPFNAVYNCIAGSCMLDCMGGNTPACSTCVQTKCAKELAACHAQSC